MCRKFVCLMIFVLLPGISGAVQALEFYDDFNTPHDYLTEGVAGTGWSGFIGRETADNIEADMNHPGQLYIQSALSDWRTFDPRGPFLYKEVAGDFVATVHVTDFAGTLDNSVFNNDSALMARVADLDAAGAGEDLESAHYFPTWTANMGRDVDDNQLRDWGFICLRYQCDSFANAKEYLQLERVGNIFYFRISEDGQTWTSLDTTNSLYDVNGYCIERPDLDGLPLQVGLMHATYTPATGYVAFDDFTMTYTAEVPHPYASDPSPQDGATNAAVNVDLMWNPGDSVQAVNGHEVYVGTSFSEVNDATTASHPNVRLYIVSNPRINSGNLELYTTYYWRVDEVNEPIRWKGKVWSFTTGAVAATDPTPSDGTIAASVDVNTLSWTPSPMAASQNLYFGTSFEVVNAGTTPDIGGLAGDAAEADIPAEYLLLQRGQTYYWRIDTVNEPYLWKGYMWSFTVCPEPTIVFSDDFNTPHDYLAYGVIGTDWDGVIGRKTPGETANVINADMDVNYPGQLYVESAGGQWAGPWDPLGPLLYKEVAGDFIATVKVTDYQDVTHNNCGIMARASTDPDVAGPGEDWVSIDYFPIWSVGIIARSADDNGRAEDGGGNGAAWNADTYLKLERTGNTFYLYTSPDGSWWYEYPDPNWSPMERPDLDGLPLQVGLHHATFSSNIGYAAFDDFSVLYAFDVPHPYASSPVPAEGATVPPEAAVLMWKPGDSVQDVNGHMVYIGTDFNNVSNATAPDFIVSDPCVVLGPLGFGTQYFWRVDEVNGPNNWKGKVWNFATEFAKATDPVPMHDSKEWAGWLASVGGNQLRWTPSSYAVSQDLYFGTSFEDVNTSATPDYAGLAGDANSAGIPTAYLPLERATTYYWRVDSNCAGDMLKGDIWWFTTAEVVFYDDFSTPHDYVSDGVVGTGWDGIIGTGDGETVDNIEANIDVCYPGQLYIQSTGGFWEPVEEGLLYGPLLYTEVAGDFVAMVHVTDFAGDMNNSVFNGNCGLMARVANEENAGPGADWVSTCYYATWTGHSSANTDGGGPVWDHYTGQRWAGDNVYDIAAAEPWLRLQRTGNTFYFSISADGLKWRPLPGSEEGIVRTDMGGLPLQVGLWQAGNGSSFTKHYAAFDDFILMRKPWPRARGPRPPDGATNVRINTRLGWKPGDFVQSVNGHQVYFGTDFNNVNDANTTSHTNVDYYVVTDPCVDPGLLELSTVYFWRVDEVNGTDLWRGNIWRFTTADWVVVEDFELYSTRDDLRISWEDGYASYPGVTSASNITLSSAIDSRLSGREPSGPIHEGADAMEFAYDNDGIVDHYEPGEWPVPYYAPYYSEIEANISYLPALSNWTIYGVKALSLPFYGEPDNDANSTEQMYVIVEDGTGAQVMAKYGDNTNEDMNNIRKPKWQQWNIDLKQFSDGGVDLNDVNKVYIGFGNRQTPELGGSGIVYFDSIRLYRPRCVPELVAGDFTSDCVVDYNDLAIFVEGWLSQPESVGPNMVGQWKFDGHGGTIVSDSIGGNNGTVFGGAALDGSGQLTLLGDDDYVQLTIGPVIASLNDCSFAAVVDYPAVGGSWQRIFDIHQPNEPDPNDLGATTVSSECMFLSSSPLRFSITITGGGEGEQLVEGTPADMPGGLHCAVVTIDVNNADPNYTTLSLYLDGSLVGRNADANLAPSVLGDTPENWLGRSAYPADPYFNGDYDEFRIYDRVLTQAEIESMYQGIILSQRSDLTGDGKVDFRDFAMLADKWLKEVLFP